MVIHLTSVQLPRLAATYLWHIFSRSRLLDIVIPDPTQEKWSVGSKLDQCLNHWASFEPASNSNWNAACLSAPPPTKLTDPLPVASLFTFQFGMKYPDFIDLEHYVAL